MGRKLILPNDEEDKAITAAAETDPDARPLTDEEWESFPTIPNDEVARILSRGRPPLAESEKKRRVTMYLDRDVIERLKEDGRGWQTRANATLREALGL